MSFLHTNSCECIKSELDLFAIPPTQTSILGGQWVHYKPLSSITEDSPLEFMVPGTMEEYIDLSQTMLYVKVKALKADGNALGVGDDVSCVNNLLHSLFTQVDVYLNQKLVSPPNNTYAYRSYIETLLNYGPAAKNSHLTGGLWYDDTPGQLDAIGALNDGFTKRKAFLAESKELDLIGHLHCDLFNQEKFLVNGVELRVKLVPSRQSFTLLAASNAKLVITEASLLVRRMKISPTVLLAHSKALEISTAKYPITRADVKVITIPQAVQGKSIDNIYLGQIPKRCIIGFVSNRAFNGDVARNPFNFQHNNLSFLSLYIDGQQIPSRPLQPDFGTDAQYVRAYQTLFSGSGIHFLNEGNNINRSAFANGFCLMAFDLTPDLSANMTTQWNLLRQGSVRLEVRFKENLDESVNCIIYSEFDSIIEIDKNRGVVVDYSS